MENTRKVIQDEKMIMHFLGYKVLYINADRNDKVESMDEVGLMYKVIPENLEKIHRANVILGCKIGTSLPEHYDIEITIMGNFIVNPDDQNVAKKLLRENAAAILYPYLRSLVSVITSQLGCQTVVLPTVNFFKIFEDSKDEDVFLTERPFENFDSQDL